MDLSPGEQKRQYQQDRKWADRLLFEVERILKSNATHLLELKIAPPEIDNKFATDMIAETSGGTIAVRLRRDGYHQRDLTIRSWRRGYDQTEIDKIRDGWASHYLYGWTNENDEIDEYILVDLNRVRELGLLENRAEIPNKDGHTKFIAIPAAELDEKGCLLNRRLRVS